MTIAVSVKELRCLTVYEQFASSFPLCVLQNLFAVKVIKFRHSENIVGKWLSKSGCNRAKGAVWH